MCIFLCLLIKNAVCMFVCAADSCKYAYTCMNPDVEFRVFIMFLMKFWSCLGSMESRKVLWIIFIISYIKHQNNNLAKCSRDTTLLFYHNNNYVSSADFLVIFIILFSKPTSHYYFQPIIIMSLPQPHNYNYTVAPKSQHYYLVPIQ